MDSINFSKISDNIKRIKLDIGLSYNAPHSEIYLSHDSDAFVFGFEPNPECIQSIARENIVQKPGHGKPLSKENKSRFCLVPVALGNVSSPQTLDFYMMNNDCGTSSLHKPRTDILGPIKEIVKVPVCNLSSFFDIFPWERFSYIEYIKIDAQGSDLDILKGAAHYLSERVVYVTAEPENNQYEGIINSENDISRYMMSIGFERIAHPNTCDPTYINTKFKHLADSIFIYQRG
jgi:FkbM family methyltransferase